MNNIGAFIRGARAQGFSSPAILGYVANTNNRVRNFANDALRYRYTYDTVVNFLERMYPGESEEYRTPEEKTRRADKKNKKKAVKDLTAATLAAANVGLLGYGLYRAGAGAAGRALGGISGMGTSPRPRLPGPKRPPSPTPPQRLGRTGGSPQTLGLPYNQAPTGTQKPMMRAPTQQGSGAPIILPYETKQQPGLGLQLAKNLKITGQLDTLARNGFDILTAASALKALVPKQIYDILQKQPGGVQAVVESYFNDIQQQPEEESFSERVKREARQQIPRPEEINQQVLQTEPQQTITSDDFIPVQSDINQKVQQAAFAGDKPRKISEFPALEKSRFAIASYQMPGESSEEFVERRRLQTAVNKTAKSLVAREEFLNQLAKIPIEKHIGLMQTTQDLIKFMAGLPNVYDVLLTDDEKEDLARIFLREDYGTMARDEDDVHGSYLDQGQVWNLILQHDPNVNKYRPQSMKKIGALKSGKMSAAEFGRYVSHAVYDVVQGKKISTELSDKINKISKAVELMDALVEAMKQGRLKEAQKEMEKMMDDEYFLSLFEKELDELLMTPEQAEKTRQFLKEDAKMAASIKASMTRKKNKLKKTNEN